MFKRANLGFVLKAADAGSIYDPHPTFSYSWDPNAIPMRRTSSSTSKQSFDLGPHPADPHSNVFPAISDHGSSMGPTTIRQRSAGQEIWVYCGNGGFVALFIHSPHRD